MWREVPPILLSSRARHNPRMTWWESWFGEEYLDLYPHRDLEAVERVLQPGGAFPCDTFGRDHVLARLVPEERRSCGGKEYRIRRSWNAKTSRLEKEIEVRRAGSSELFRESVRAYAPDELT